MTMLWRENNFAFARRIPVRWTAHSWRPKINPPAGAARVGTQDDFHPAGRARELCIVRQASAAHARRMARLNSTSLIFPRLRGNKPPTIQL